MSYQKHKDMDESHINISMRKEVIMKVHILHNMTFWKGKTKGTINSPAIAKCTGEG